MVGKRSHLNKAPKTQQICHYKHTKKTSEHFLFFNAGIDFRLRYNFANIGSFAKVSVRVYIYNSLVKLCTNIWSCSLTHTLGLHKRITLNVTKSCQYKWYHILDDYCCLRLLSAPCYCSKEKTLAWNPHKH